MAIPKIDEQNITAAIKYIDEHGIPAVSYTHLDVYKRQVSKCNLGTIIYL